MISTSLYFSVKIQYKKENLKSVFWASEQSLGAQNGIPVSQTEYVTGSRHQRTYIITIPYICIITIHITVISIAQFTGYTKHHIQ